MGASPSSIADHVAATPDLDRYGPPVRSAWQDVDWREHQRWLQVNARRINLVELGDGPPIVFVHGHSGSWSNWLENLPHFAERHRVVAFDLPGFGHSEMPAQGVSIENYGRTVDAVMEELGVDQAAIVGNSMGGFVGAELALKFPHRVQRLVLVSAAGLATKYIGLSAEFLRRRSVVAFARAVNTYASFPEARASTLMRRPRLRRALLGMVAHHPDRLPVPISMELVRGTGKPAAADALDALLDYDYRDRLEDVRCPTLIVWGEDDRTVPVESAGEYERLIPGSRKVVLLDTGHVPMVERPVRFNALLDEFLAEEPS
ncbi:MAG: alpha/beta hydrolase [Actinomycetota bacterium]|nr:alpha/beta hydrolase [Actinomycetota bacterium]